MKTLTALLLAALLLLSGCETMWGLGKDLENLGRWIQDTAARN